MKKIIFACLILISCVDKTQFTEEKKTFRIDSVEYQPIGFPSVANVDPRWIAHTEFGKFTYKHPVKVGDTVTLIIMTKKRDTVVFDPIIEHSEIKEEK
jgi:hypothetical protein